MVVPVGGRERSFVPRVANIGLYRRALAGGCAECDAKRGEACRIPHPPGDEQAVCNARWMGIFAGRASDPYLNPKPYITPKGTKKEYF
jgi:hypothetical protein